MLCLLYRRVYEALLRLNSDENSEQGNKLVQCVAVQPMRFQSKCIFSLSCHEVLLHARLSCSTFKTFIYLSTSYKSVIYGWFLINTLYC